jgi:TM2 domain-containing membrane protein YozV
MNDHRVTRTAALDGAGKNIAVAYLLWWFVGILGIHRFYLERPKTGLVQLLLLIFGWLPLFLGWIALGIWWLLDAYFVQEYVRQYNDLNDGRPLAISLMTQTSNKALASNAILISGFCKDGHVIRLVVDQEQVETRQSGLSIGRADHCDMILDDPTVSREHALVQYDGGFFSLRDLGSSNGTFLNGKRLVVGASSKIRSGDRLKIGKIMLSVSSI